VHLLHGLLVAGKGRKAGGIFAWWLLLDSYCSIFVLLASDFFWCDAGGVMSSANESDRDVTVWVVPAWFRV
jgi:hypothetical protein